MENKTIKELKHDVDILTWGLEAQKVQNGVLFKENADLKIEVDRLNSELRRQNAKFWGNDD